MVPRYNDLHDTAHSVGLQHITVSFNRFLAYFAEARARQYQRDSQANEDEETRSNVEATSLMIFIIDTYCIIIYKMAEPVRVSVVDVSGDTAEDTWPLLVEAVKAADFVAIDLELSGLGNRKALRAK